VCREFRRSLSSALSARDRRRSGSAGEQQGSERKKAALNATKPAPVDTRGGRAARRAAATTDPSRAERHRQQDDDEIHRNPPEVHALFLAQRLRRVGIGVVLLLALPYPALAYQVETWAGNIAYVNLNKVSGYHKVGVNAKQQTRTFLIGQDFKGVKTSLDNAPRTLQDLKPGMQVQVQYYKDTVFGANKAGEIDIFNGFNLNLMQTPPPPTQQ
jgi:hypothetical protein